MAWFLALLRMLLPRNSVCARALRALVPVLKRDPKLAGFLPILTQIGLPPRLALRDLVHQPAKQSTLMLALLTMRLASHTKISMFETFKLMLRPENFSTHYTTTKSFPEQPSWTRNNPSIAIVVATAHHPRCHPVRPIGTTVVVHCQVAAMTLSRALPL